MKNLMVTWRFILLVLVVLSCFVAEGGRTTTLRSPVLEKMGSTPDVDVAPGAPSQLPRRGDILLTSRWDVTSPIGNKNTYPLLNTTGAIAAWLANRVEWVYTTSQSFVEGITRGNMNLPLSAAVNANVSDNVTGPATYNIGRIENLYGEKLTAPWMRGFAQLPYYGCVNNPHYQQEIFLPRAAFLLFDVGATSLQHDDPLTNYEAVTWPEGGCYCKYCMAKFTKYAFEQGLIRNTTWNYKQYLLGRQAYKTTGGEADELRVAFERFQFQSATEHPRQLREYLVEKNRLQPPSSQKSSIVLSCNAPDEAILGGPVSRWNNVTENFNYSIAELEESNATPDQLHDAFLEKSSGGQVPDGKMQIFTMPKIGIPDLPTWDKVLTRKVTGMAFTLGSNVLVPWNIYLPTPQAARFYGNVSDFIDQFQVLKHFGSSWFNPFDQLLHTWKAGPSVIRVTISTEGGGDREEEEEEAQSVYWSVRGCSGGGRAGNCPSSSFSEGQVQGGARTFLVHLLDWDWAGHRHQESPKAPVNYPLPSNRGRNLTVSLNFTDSSVQSSSLPPAAARMMTVYWLSPTGKVQPVPSSSSPPDCAACGRFSVSDEILIPWGVFSVTFFP